MCGRDWSSDVCSSDLGMVPQVASPMRLSKTPVEYRTAPPLLGEHTLKVLQEVLGLSAVSVAALREAGVI